MPFSQRKKMLEKARAKNKKPKSSAGISSIPNITVGTQVGELLHLLQLLSSWITPGDLESCIVLMIQRCPSLGVFEE